MRISTLVAAVALALAGCSGSTSAGSGGTGSGTGGGGSSSSGTTTGAACPQALCNGACCAPADVCLPNSSGDLACVQTCTTSSQCTGNSPPCCQTAIQSNGNYDAKGVCTDAVFGQKTCLCTASSECLAQLECVPIQKPGNTQGAGIVTGPYVCALDDGRSFDGCAGFFCDEPDQACATDKSGNLFCSTPCSSNSDCGNPGVACCDDGCDAGVTCCGLCGH